MHERSSNNKQLWVPGQNIELHTDYPTPTQAELRTKWNEYLGGNDEVVDAPQVYGVMRLPKSAPRAYASVDVCEVLRTTHESMRTVEESVAGKLKSMHAYGDGLSFANSTDITSVLQVLINKGLIEPVEGIKEIAHIMRGWREDGIYTFANTSTLPGCEPGTIDFFSEHVSGGFDGLVLPRNHDGTLPMTKGVVAKNMITALPPTSGEIVAFHIDDSPHHNVAFRKEVGSISKSAVKTFLPQYETHYPVDQGSVMTETPLQAFQQADIFVRNTLNL